MRKNRVNRSDFLKVEKALHDSEHHACQVLYSIVEKKDINRPQLGRFVELFTEKRRNEQILVILDTIGDGK